MWRIALLCLVTLTVACTDGPGAPSKNTDGLSLQEGDPPPPPLEDGDGTVSLARSDISVDATDVGTQAVCEPPPAAFNFHVAVEYFQNKSENVAWVHITPAPASSFDPDPGSGLGIVRETANPSTASLEERQHAGGTLRVLGTDLQEYEIHLRDYTGTSLLAFERGLPGIGGSTGGLVAEVTACGGTTAYTGNLTVTWRCFAECKDEDEEL